MGKQKKSAIETRLETLESIVLSDGQNIGEARNNLCNYTGKPR